MGIFRFVFTSPHNRRWRKGNFLVIVLLVGLLVMGGMGALHLYMSSASLTSAIKTQDNLVNSANEDRLSSLREEAEKYISTDLYLGLQSNMTYETLSEGLKDIFNRYSFVNYLNSRGISSNQVNSDNISVSTLTSANIRQGSIATYPVINNTISDNGVFVSGLSVSSENLTTGSKDSRTVNLSYLRLPNSLFSWYHGVSSDTQAAPKLDNVTIAQDKSGVLYFANPPQVSELLSGIPNTSSVIIRGDSGQLLSNIYDYSVMDSYQGSLYDYINLSGDGGATSKNYNINGRFWYYPNMPSDFKVNMYTVSFSRASVYFGRDSNASAQPQTAPLSGYGQTVPVLVIPREDANERLISLFDYIGSPLSAMEDAVVDGKVCRRWYLDLSGDNAWSARTESVALFLSILSDVYSNVELPESVATLTIRDVLHPSIQLPSDSDISEGNFNYVSGLLRSASGAITAPAGWRSGGQNGYFNFYLANLPLHSAFDGSYKLYTDSTTAPLLGKLITFSTGATGHFVRFPWLGKETLFFLISGASIGSSGSSALVLYSADGDSGAIYLGGSPNSASWWKCTPNSKSALITPLPVYISEDFNSDRKTFLLATGERLHLAYPHKSLATPGDDAQISINDTPLANSNGLSLAPATDSEWIATVYDLSDIAANIKAYTVNDRNSAFYIANSTVRGTIACEAINLGHAEVLCEVIVCFYDPNAISPSVLSQIQYTVNGVSSGTIGGLSPSPIYIPYGTLPDSTELAKYISSSISEGYISSKVSAELMKDYYLNAFISMLYTKLPSVGRLDKIARVFKYSRLYSPLKERLEDLVSAYGDGLGNNSKLKFYLGWCSRNAASANSNILATELGSLSE